MNPERPESEQDTGFSQAEQYQQLGQEQPKQPEFSNWRKWVAKGTVVLAGMGLLGGGAEGIKEKPAHPGPTPNLVNPSPEVTAAPTPERTQNFEPLPKEILTEVIAADSQYENLSQHKLGLIGSIKTSGGREVTNISVDGGSLEVPAEEMKADLEFFESIAKQGKVINYTYQPDGRPREISFTIGPSNKLKSFFLHIPESERLVDVAPTVAGMKNPDSHALTSNVSDAAELPTVTAIQAESKSLGYSNAGLEIANNVYNLATESCQTSVYVTQEMGQELVCNSYSMALKAARARASYDDYKSFVESRGYLNGYEDVQAKFIQLSAEDYQAISNQLG